MPSEEAALPGIGEALAEPDADVLGFVADMYAVQLDQLPALLVDRGEPADSAADRAREVVARLRATGYATCGQLTVGAQWIWATRQGLDACGLESRRVKPTGSLLRHTHAVTEVRLALERAPGYRAGGATWRSDRRIRARVGVPPHYAHLPDGEVGWPADGGSPWAGQIWDIEVELNSKSIDHTARIMRDVLARTGEHGCPPSAITVPGQPPWYTRLVYLCTRAALPAVLKARIQLPAELAARIEVYDLPESAAQLNTPKRGW